jgi:hypothetical protein
MMTVDTEMLKRVSAELSARGFLPRGSPKTFDALNKNGREIQQLLRSYAERTGFPLDELNRLRAERQAERRRLFACQAADAAQVANEEEVRFLQAMESRRETLNRLSAPATVLTLGLPNDVVLLNNVNPVDFHPHIESLNSYAKIAINTTAGSDSPVVIFKWQWQNPSQSAAVINVGTMLRFSGFCEVIADTGIFSGHNNFLGVFALLGLSTDDGTPLVFIPPGNTFQTVAFLDVQGGGVLGEHGYALQTFAAKPVGLDADFVIVPGGALAKLNVILQLHYSIEDGDHVDEVRVDFARVGCPFFHIQVL